VPRELKSVDLIPSLGVLVEELDLREELDPDMAAELRDLLWTRGLLLFRGQELSPVDQVRLVELFGTIAPIGPEGSLYSFVTNEGEQQVSGEARLPFHSDLTYTPVPYDVICLAALEVRGPAAPTRFASPVSGYAMLPRELQARIKTLNNIHLHFHFDGTDFVRTDRHDLPARREYRTLEEYPRHSWPVVVPHHKTGAPMLFVSEWFSHIDGLDENEGAELLNELFRFLYAPANVYEHYWTEGDVIIWDNLGIQHERPGYHDKGAVRKLRKAIAVPGGRTLKELYQLANATMPGSFVQTQNI
jgi:taurine dioxygenase